jgi:hypothetical protein
MSMNTKGIYYHLSAAADVARPLKASPTGFDQGVQDGLDRALDLIRESLGRKDSLECLEAFCAMARTSASKNEYRAGVSRGAAIMQASLADYIDEQNAKRVRRPTVPLHAPSSESTSTTAFLPDTELAEPGATAPAVGEDA